MTLLDILKRISSFQAARYEKLTGETLDIAKAGILRHLRACARNKCVPGADAIREIIDDAQNGIKVFDVADHDEAYIRRLK